MKKLYLFMSLLTLALYSFAYDFEVYDIYYNITSTTDLTCEVTYQDPTIRYSGKIVIPETVTHQGTTYKVTSIGSMAFYLSEITKITIPNSITNIGSYAFYSTSLTDITIPNGVTTIKRNTFGSSGIRNIIIPNSVVEIEEDAFYNSRLSSITIPNNVEVIGPRAFYKCSQLNKIIIEDGETALKLVSDYSDDRNLFYDCSIKTLYLGRKLIYRDGFPPFFGCNELEELKFNNNLTSIEDRAFGGCHRLTDLILPDSLISIGDGAFGGCHRLTDLILPDGLISIGDSAFYSCDSLKNIVFPNKLTNIGQEAFYHGKFECITIPCSVTRIGEKAFSYCRNLTDVIFNAENCQQMEEDIFYECRNIKSFTFGDNVKTIPDRCVSGIYSITEITIPEGVTSIGNSSFRSCTELKKVEIPESVTSIGDFAFYYCSNLRSISLPDNLISIGHSAFSYTKCTTKKQGLYYLDNWCVDYDSFYDIVEIEIKDGTKSIADGVFMNTGIENITFPNSLTSIGANAFYGCKNIENITFPNSLTSIGSNAFSDCHLYNVTSMRVNAISVPYSIFLNEVYENATLYIPNGALNSYQNTSPWNNFVKIQEIEMSGVEDTLTNDVDITEEYYNLQGVKIENPSNGIFVKKQGSKTTKVVL